MTSDQILSSWQKKQFKTVYWLEGEEAYFIDSLVDVAEKNMLTSEEAAFNLIVHYGRDTQWSQVVNSCMRYPMFAERQVVILKEAQQMKEIEKLEAYISKPLPTTIFIVAHKEKKVDGRSKLSKILKEHAVLFTANKIKENELNGWIQNYMLSGGYKATPKAVLLIAEHVGNDLARIVNELDKLFIHVGDRKEILEEDIEACIGISKEFNLFEFQNALGRKDFKKSFQILQYFEQNPKAAPIQMLLPVIYSYFSKVYMLASVRGDDKAISAQTGINGWFLKEYKQTAALYGYQGIESALLLMHEYNLRSVGVNNVRNTDASLLKELLSKMMLF